MTLGYYVQIIYYSVSALYVGTTAMKSEPSKDVQMSNALRMLLVSHIHGASSTSGKGRVSCGWDSIVLSETIEVHGISTAYSVAG